VNSHQAKFFAALSKMSKLKGVSKRMANKVELDHLKETKPAAVKTHDFKSKPVDFRYEVFSLLLFIHLLLLMSPAPFCSHSLWS
jgi:hypothetical protein